MTIIKNKTFILNDAGIVTEVDEDLNIEDLQAMGVSDQRPMPTYALNRVQEYPSIPEQLDKIFHEGVDAWKAEIQAIKDKYPKDTV